MEAAFISIDAELQECIAQLDVSQKKSLLELIKSFVKKEEMKPQTIEKYNKELEDADKRIDNGEFYTHEEAMAIIKSW